MYLYNLLEYLDTIKLTTFHFFTIITIYHSNKK